MAAAKVADFYSRLQCRASEQADAMIAYTQAAFTGPEMWVALLMEQWPSSWFVNGRPRYWQPVCTLPKALFRPPDSGGAVGDALRRSLSIYRIRGRSVYFHNKLPIRVVVYVDDLHGWTQCEPPHSVGHDSQDGQDGALWALRTVLGVQTVRSARTYHLQGSVDVRAIFHIVEA